jgi:hypothetical protein
LPWKTLASIGTPAKMFANATPKSSIEGAADDEERVPAGAPRRALELAPVLERDAPDDEGEEQQHERVYIALNIAA